MKKFGAVLGAAGAVVVGTVLLGVSAASAKSTPNRTAPRSVICIAQSGGLKGAIGMPGDTGAVGPSGADIIGVVRSIHVRTPNCADFPSVCAFPVSGAPGLKGATGATGPRGDTAPTPNGVPRLVHPRQPSPCPDPTCAYLLAGDTGDTGVAGATGPQGATGRFSPGPARAPHHLVAGGGYGAGQLVTLPVCTATLPSTGGRSTTLVPWAITLLAAGVATMFVTRRRRSVGV